jgi:hypothetical protein
MFLVNSMHHAMGTGETGIIRIEKNDLHLKQEVHKLDAAARFCSGIEDV